MRISVWLAIFLSLPAVAQADPKLESLTVDARDLPSFRFGPEHADLRWFTVDGCGTVADLVPLRGLPAGVEIQLGKSDCLVVERVDGLEQADVVMSYAVHRDLSGLAKATRLRRLHLNNGPLPVAALVALTLPALEYLDVNMLKNRSADLTRFLNSPVVRKVRHLGISVDRAPVLPALPNLTGLSVSLMLADPRRVDLSFVRKAPGLEHLQVGGAEQADLSPLLSLQKLETLDIAGLCHVDPSPLAKLPKLRWMTISMLVADDDKPVRAGLDVIRSNPYVLCSPP